MNRARFIQKIIFTAGVSLATAFTLSCGDHNPDVSTCGGYEYDSSKYYCKSNTLVPIDDNTPSSSGGLPPSSGAPSSSSLPPSSGGTPSSSSNLPLSSGGSTGPTNWTAVPNSAFGTSYIQGVAFGNGTWVAVGRDGKIAYSADGSNWAAVSQTVFGSGGFIWDVAYDNGMFVAVGGTSGNGGGRIAYSADGISWTEVNAPFSTSARAVAYGGGTWVITSWSGNAGYSLDGTSWTSVSVGDVFGSGTNSGTGGIAYGNNRFVGVGVNGIGYSPNGASWTKVTNSAFGSSGVEGIAYGSGKWVAGGSGGKIAYSTDGINWTLASNSAFGTTAINAVAYGNNTWVAAGNEGKMAYSSDGVTWTLIGNSGFGTTAILAVAYGNGRFVAVGGEGKIAYAGENLNPGNQGTAPAIATASLPDGTVGTAYSQTLTATGSTPITWSLESGTLSAGLTLSASGIISGTPTTAGTSTFTVKAANSAGSGTKQLSITIATSGGGAYAIGSVGPAGGLIFYDRGNDDGAWRYMEAAPANTEFNSAWGSGPNNTANIEGLSPIIGMGKQNTQLIIAAYGENASAAKQCADLTVNGYSDWFLPSREELGLMYNNLWKEKKLGGFMDAGYWTSMSNYYNDATIINFSNGSPEWGGHKNNIYYVRAARYF